MHNLHFVRTKAKGPKTAIIDVESAIENWGNENNWRRVFGCVNKRGKKTIVDREARWTYITYKDTKKILEDTYSVPDPDALRAWEKVYEKEPEGFEWYQIKKYAEWQLHRRWTHARERWADLDIVSSYPRKFNIWRDTFADWDLSEIGLTEIRTSDDGKDYIVFVDMHS